MGSIRGQKNSHGSNSGEHNNRIIKSVRHMKKVPGWSWIEVKNEVHAFNVKDHSRPQSEDIYKLLLQLKDGTKLFDNL